MSTDPNSTNSATPSTRSALSLDAWALLIALVLALIVKFNLWQNIPW